MMKLNISEIMILLNSIIPTNKGPPKLKITHLIFKMMKIVTTLLVEKPSHSNSPKHAWNHKYMNKVMNS